jgi:hypothetical protein
MQHLKMQVGQNKYKMKIAIVLTGHSRDFNSTFKNFEEHLFKKYNADVYFNTWDVNQRSINIVGRGFNLAHHPIDKNDLLEKLKPYIKNYNFESYENYEKNRFPNIEFSDRPDDVFKVNERAIYHGSYYVERIRDQWWVVKNAWKLIENPYQYDLIMRVRFDMLIEHIEFKKSEFVVPKSEIEFYKIGTDWSDYFAYGTPESMEKYFHFFDHIETLYKEYNMDISHAEQMHEFYMREYGNKTESFIDFDIKYNKV